MSVSASHIRGDIVLTGSQFSDLLKFARQLNEEEQRHIRARLAEEELAIFDILSKPRLEITAREEKRVKNVSKDLLSTLKAKALVLDWRKRQQSRAAVRLCVEEWLDKLPPVYTPAIYQAKCEAGYQYVYDNYGGSGVHVRAEIFGGRGLI